jgi:hypothetical protein
MGWPSVEENQKGAGSGMRTTLQFLGLMATGLVVATIVGLLAGRLLPPDAGASERIVLDYGSLSLGLAVGLVLGALSRVSWSEAARRAADRLLCGGWRLARLAALIAVGAAVLYYV